MRFHFASFCDCIFLYTGCFCCLPCGGWSCLKSLCRLPVGRAWFHLLVAWGWVFSLWWQGCVQEDFKKTFCWWWGCMPPCWLAWSVKALGSTVFWVGLGLVGEMATSTTVHTNEYSLDAITSTFVPPVSQSHAQLCRKPSNTSRQVWSHLLLGHCFFSLCPGVHQILCHHPRVELLFSSALWNSCDETLLAFSARSLRVPPLIVRFSGWRADVGLRTFTYVEEFPWYNYFPVCSLPFNGYIWFYSDGFPPTACLWLLICLWVFIIFSCRSSFFFLFSRF